MRVRRASPPTTRMRRFLRVQVPHHSRFVISGESKLLRLLARVQCERWVPRHTLRPGRARTGTDAAGYLEALPNTVRPSTDGHTTSPEGWGLLRANPAGAQTRVKVERRQRSEDERP